jgi:hypothetical protein
MIPRLNPPAAGVSEVNKEASPSQDIEELTYVTGAVRLLGLLTVGKQFPVAPRRWSDRSAAGSWKARVWPGRALKGAIVRRVLPAYPRGTKTRGPVSVFAEYRIALEICEGSTNLRTSRPTAFTSAAQSAIEWVDRPVRFENRLGYRSQAGWRAGQGESTNEAACAIAVDQPVPCNVREMGERPDHCDRPTEPSGPTAIHCLRTA